MPDENGNVRGISVPAEAWERIFGKPAPECGWRDRPHGGECDVCHFIEPCLGFNIDPGFRLPPGSLKSVYTKDEQ